MSDFIDISLNIHELRNVRQHFVKGKKGEYLDCRIIETPDSEYNDGILVRKVSKEDRDKGIKGEIIGSVKDWSKHNDGQQKAASGNNNDAPAVVEGSEDLPF